MTKVLSALIFIIVFASCTMNTKEREGNEMANLSQLPSPAQAPSAQPYLFTDKNGVVYLSWIEKSGDKSLLKFSTLNNGQWSEPVVITSGDNWFVNWADFPMLASNGEAHLMAHILVKSGEGMFEYDVKLITSRDNGNSWSGPMLLHDDGKKAEHGFVSLMPYQDQFFVAWLDGRNTVIEGAVEHHEGHHGEMTLRAAIVDTEGIKTGEWELDNRVCECCQTSAALTSNGPIVVYRDRSEDEIRDISIVRFINGQWTAPKTIFPDHWKIAGCPVNGPQAVAQGNNLAVAWFSVPDKKAQVNIIFSEDGGATFNDPIRIDEGSAIGRVDVVLLDEKSAMISWMEGSMIKVAKVHKDGTKEASIIIASSYDSRSSGFPQMTKSGNKLVFAWTDDQEKTVKVASLSL